MATSGPEISWQTVIGALSAVGILAAASWAVFQTQFGDVEKELATDRQHITELTSDLDKYLTIREHSEYRASVAAQIDDLRVRSAALEAARVSILARMAREPIEAATFQAVIAAIGKQIDQTQAQIADINRQIAAALIIIDNNAGLRKNPALPP